MLFQNLTNNKPKTFMDYEPGKVPAKKEWASLSEAQTQPKNIFESNIKLVGDDMTEKDYDAFFEGFKSADDEPVWKKELSLPKVRVQNPIYKTPEQIRTKTQPLPYSPISGGELKPKPLPYRPSEHGEAKPQTLSYRPSEHGEAKFVPYSATPVTYAQKRNSSSEPKETLWDKAKEYVADFPQNLHTANVLATTPDPVSALVRLAAGKVLEDHVKEKHYERNEYNVDLPRTKEEAEALGWETEIANCHQNTRQPDRKPNVKYVSPDGKREVIFDSDGNVVTADEDVGTYNYASPDWKLQHGLLDVLPWIVYGNTPEDTTTPWSRTKGMLTFER